MLQRQRNWDVKLVQWSSQLIGKEYVWGETDCWTLAVEAQRLIYDDETLFEDVPGYTTAIGAARGAKKVGGPVGALEDSGATQVGFWHRQSGDVIVYPKDGNAIANVGVVLRRAVLRSHEEKGVFRSPLADLPVDATVWRMDA